MDCPRAHQWYELERGRATREEAEELRRHSGDCETCRREADEMRNVAAALERLAPATRADLSETGEESLRRRARVHGLLGRPLKAPLILRFGRWPAVRRALPLAAAAAAIVLFALVLGQMKSPEPDRPAGALERLAAAAGQAAGAEDLSALSPVARAAVAEELASADPAADRLTDLLLVAYIADRPKEDRQLRDVAFLVDGVRRRRKRPVSVARAGWMHPPACTVPLAVGAVASDESGVPAARAAMLRGDYEAALAALPTDGSADPQRVWCLEMLGRSIEAAALVADLPDPERSPMARALRAHLVLKQEKNVVEALAQYEALAEEDDRYWFAAGYLCRYELADMRGAGVRFSRIRDPRTAAYVAEEFATELAFARSEPRNVVLEDFEAYDLGEPRDWGLVETRGGQFRIVPVPGGNALQLDQVGRSGAEILTGSPFGENYVLSFDFVVLDPGGDYVLGAAVYRRKNHTGYVLELSPYRLRLVKQFASSARVGTGSHTRPERLVVAPLKAAARLREPFEAGTWHTMKLHVQQTDEGVALAGKVWPRSEDEPLDWEVVWTDAGQAGEPLSGGLAGIQASRARVIVDNLAIARNAPSDMSVPAASAP